MPRARLRTPVLAVLLPVLLMVTGCTPLGPDPLRVTALLDDSAGLFVGNDVGVLGVPVGSITGIEPRGPVVAVELEVERRDLPASVGAVVVARSVATDRYLELTPAFSDGPRLEDGATIPLERTRTPAEFDEVLATLHDLGQGLRGPDGEARSLRHVLRAGADALGGRGAELNATLEQLAAAAGALSDQRGDIVGTIEELDELTTLLVTNEVVVDEFVASVTDATDMFADEGHRFGRALDSLTRALRTLARFVRENRSQLKGNLSGLTRVTESILEHEKQLAETVEILPITFENTGNAIDESDRLDVKLPLQHLSPAAPVTDELCAVLPGDLCNELGTHPDLLSILRALLGGGAR